MAKAKSDESVLPEVELVERFIKLSAKSKAIFRDVCEVEEELLRVLARAPENRFPMPDGRVVSRKDNFSDKNTFFKPTATKRFEVALG